MIYFASDVHLGLKFGDRTPRSREKEFVDFLSSIEENCTELFLLGDIFDFWFEWKRTVPQGYVRVLGKLASMCDKGVKIHFFPGNHDLWINDYLEQEVGMIIHREPFVGQRDGKTLFLSHGDTFYKYKPVGLFLSTMFRSQWARWIAQRVIHPDAMVRFGMNWSQSNRDKRGGVAHVFTGDDDFLVKFCRSYIEEHKEKIDYFVFGHLHTPVEFKLDNRSSLIILGEWVENPFYAVLESGVIKLVKVNV